MDTVLITGGAGFLGSHLIRHLLHVRPDWKIRSFDLLGRQSEPGRLNDVFDQPNLEVWQGDVADRWAVRQAMRDARYVFHLAAENSTNPREVGNNTPLRTNLAGMCTLLEAAREFHVEGLVAVSSPLVFASSRELHPEKETPCPEGFAPITRACAEWMARAYAEEYELPVSIVRPAQVYGTWQLPNQILPWMCWQTMNGRTGIISYNISQYWLHVEDFCSGVLAVLDQGKVGGIYHLAGDDEVDGIGMAELVSKYLGKPCKISLSPTARSSHLLLDDTASELALAWVPEVELEDGVEQAVRWYQDHAGWLQNQWRRLYYSTER